MDVDANFEWIDSEYIIWNVCSISWLINPKCINHLVESQQMGWEMIFPDYIIQKVLKPSRL